MTLVPNRHLYLGEGRGLPTNYHHFASLYKETPLLRPLPQTTKHISPSLPLPAQKVVGPMVLNILKVKYRWFWSQQLNQFFTATLKAFALQLLRYHYCSLLNLILFKYPAIVWRVTICRIFLYENFYEMLVWQNVWRLDWWPLRTFPSS